MAGVGVFPGSFNPPTIAHLAMARAAFAAYRLERVELVISVSALGKERVDHPRLEHRLEVVRESLAPYPGLEVRVTEEQLLVDIAQGYDLLIIGADKWRQIHETQWYRGGAAERDEALSRLPPLALFDRAGVRLPGSVQERVSAGPEIDEVTHTLSAVSSTRARQGELDLMTPAARRFALESGAWIDPEGYEVWLAEQDRRT